MRKLTTILCSIAFAISGICLAKVTATSNTTTTTVSAANVPTLDMSSVKMPVDLLLEKQVHESASIKPTGRVDTV